MPLDTLWIYEWISLNHFSSLADPRNTIHSWWKDSVSLIEEDSNKFPLVDQIDNSRRFNRQHFSTAVLFVWILKGMFDFHQLVIRITQFLDELYSIHETDSTEEVVVCQTDERRICCGRDSNGEWTSASVYPKEAHLLLLFTSWPVILNEDLISSRTFIVVEWKEDLIIENKERMFARFVRSSLVRAESIERAIMQSTELCSNSEVCLKPQNCSLEFVEMFLLSQATNTATTKWWISDEERKTQWMFERLSRSSKRYSW